MTDEELKTRETLKVAAEGAAFTAANQIGQCTTPGSAAICFHLEALRVTVDHRGFEIACALRDIAHALGLEPK